MRGPEEKEVAYYSQVRCETCKYLCSNPKQDRNLNPWICGNENKGSTFNKGVKADSHASCKYWEHRDMLVWLKRYFDAVQQVKDPKDKHYTDRRKWRNIYMFAPVVYKYYNEHKNDIGIDIYQVLSSRYGLNIKTIKKLIDICKKEDANDNHGQE